MKYTRKSNGKHSVGIVQENEKLELERLKITL